MYNKQLVTRMEDVRDIVRDIEKWGVFSYDTETNAVPKRTRNKVQEGGINEHEDKIIGIALAWGGTHRLNEWNMPNMDDMPNSVYIPLIHYDKKVIAKPLVMRKDGKGPLKHQPPPDTVYEPSSLVLPEAEVMELLNELLSNCNLCCIVQNWKFEINMLRKYGIEFNCQVHDTMLLDYVLDPQRRHGLKEQANDHINYGMTQTKDLMTDGQTKRKIRMDQAPLWEVASYACDDVLATLWLWDFHTKRDRYEDEDNVYQMEMALSPVLADMEYRGVLVDVPYFQKLSSDFKFDLTQKEITIHSHADKDFNVNSTNQLRDVLFRDLGLRPTKRTGSGLASTDQETLVRMRGQHPIIDHLLEYRELEKLWNTYCHKMPTLIRNTGRLHTTYRQAKTATGRLSSANPNLQNIPRKDKRIKRGFVAQKGHVLLCADNSQIELRVLAHLSGCPILTEGYRHGADIHRLTASRAYGVPEAEVTDEQRTAAKTINFGIIYGMTKWGLSKDLKVTPDKAQEFIDNYLAGYPAVCDFVEKCIAFMYKYGYAETIMGRRRPLKVERGFGPYEAAKMERRAINTPVQGSAGDLIKLAMIDIDRRLQEEGYGSRMILQVHDEVVLECPESEADDVSELVVECMQLGQPLSVPLVIEPNIGDTWLEAK